MTRGSGTAVGHSEVVPQVKLTSIFETSPSAAIALRLADRIAYMICCRIEQRYARILAATLLQPSSDRC
jgi:hypothetical protein